MGNGEVYGKFVLTAFVGFCVYLILFLNLVSLLKIDTAFRLTLGVVRNIIANCFHEYLLS